MVVRADFFQTVLLDAKSVQPELPFLNRVVAPRLEAEVFRKVVDLILGREKGSRDVGIAGVCRHDAKCKGFVFHIHTYANQSNFFYLMVNKKVLMDF